jgi:hypothetical protein
MSNEFSGNLSDFRPQREFKKGDRVMIGGKICTVERFYPDKFHLMAAVKVKEHSRVVYITDIE